MIQNETFTIEGNHEDKAGNPLPYLRRTRNDLWKPASIRYNAWIQYVRKQCYMQTTLTERELTTMLSVKMVAGKKVTHRTTTTLHPFVLEPTQYAHMAITIWWANEAHADPDNIFKGLADALFKNDKHLSGSFDFVHAPDKRGRVEVNITISQALELVAPARKRKEKKAVNQAIL